MADLVSSALNSTKSIQVPVEKHEQHSLLQSPQGQLLLDGVWDDCPGTAARTGGLGVTWKKHNIKTQAGVS